MEGTYLYFRCPCPVSEKSAGTSCTSRVCRYAEIAPTAGASYTHSPVFSHFSPERKLLTCQTASSSQMKCSSSTHSFAEENERLPPTPLPREEFQWISYRNEDLSSTERLKQTAKDVAQKRAESKTVGQSDPTKTGNQTRSRRVRTAFTPFQLLCLETSFEKNHYVVGSERKQLASYLKLSETQVKVWFQNRRTKWKRQALENRPELHKDPLTP